MQSSLVRHSSTVRNSTQAIRQGHGLQGILYLRAQTHPVLPMQPQGSQIEL
jgi:hypothetical protein